jgi:hypothetical protein
MASPPRFDATALSAYLEARCVTLAASRVDFATCSPIDRAISLAFRFASPLASAKLEKNAW